MLLSTQQWKYRWLFLIFLLPTLSTAYNQWSKSISDQGEEIWQSTSDFIPLRSQSFGSIRIGRAMSAEFDFQFGGRTNDPKSDAYEMFFRVGFDSKLGNGCSGQGSRYPSFWLASGSDTLHVSVSDSNSCQPSYSLAAYGTISIGVWYHVVIRYNATTLRVDILGGDDDQSPWTQSWARHHTMRDHLGRNASIWWMSGKFGPTDYNRGNGTFSNITITSADFQYTQPPTADPTTIVPTVTGPPTRIPMPSPAPPSPSSSPSIPSPIPTEDFILSVLTTTSTSRSDEQSTQNTAGNGTEIVTKLDEDEREHFAWGDPLGSVNMAAVVCVAVIAACCSCAATVMLIGVGVKRQFKGMKAELQPQDSRRSTRSMVKGHRRSTHVNLNSVDMDADDLMMGDIDDLGNGKVGEARAIRYSDDLQHSDLEMADVEEEELVGAPTLSPEEDGISVLKALGIHVSPRMNWPMLQHQIELDEDSFSEENLAPMEVPRVVSTENMKNHEMAEGFGSVMR